MNNSRTTLLRIIAPRQRQMITLLVGSLSLCISCISAHGQQGPGFAAIHTADLRADLSVMASDHFRGRGSATADELKVSAWLAARAQAAGLEPAGEDGTWFQFFPVWRNRLASDSKIEIGDRSFPLWTNALMPQTAPGRTDAPILFINRADTNRQDIAGKAIVLQASPEGIDGSLSVPERRYPILLYRKYAAGLIHKGAAAVLFIADSLIESAWTLNASYYREGIYDIAGGPHENPAPEVPVIFLGQAALDWIQQPGLRLHADIKVEKFESISVNVIGVSKGTDPALSKEVVLFSAHQDHDGIKAPMPPQPISPAASQPTSSAPNTQDSIYNGADDNASTCVALLAIARAFHRQPAHRPALFVWHGSEEVGLLGSRWFSTHPTVPASSITAALNGDMIGRNSPDSAALLGMTPPHRNSRSLVAAALAANAEGPRFTLDTLYDRADHKEHWYFRSDHLSYARAGIPALFFTTLLHPDYHTPADEAALIDFKKLTKMTQWIYLTGWKLANAPSRPSVDPGFRLER